MALAEPLLTSRYSDGKERRLTRRIARETWVGPAAVSRLTGGVWMESMGNKSTRCVASSTIHLSFVLSFLRGILSYDYVVLRTVCGSCGVAWRGLLPSIIACWSEILAYERVTTYRNTNNTTAYKVNMKNIHIWNMCIYMRSYIYLNMIYVDVFVDM